MNIFSQVAEVIKKLFGKASIEEKINQGFEYVNKVMNYKEELKNTKK